MDPTYQRIQTHLQDLKLCRIPQVLDRVAEDAAKAEWTYLDFLDRLLSAEAEAKDERGVTTRIRMARFPFQKTYHGGEVLAPVHGVAQGVDQSQVLGALLHKLLEVVPVLPQLLLHPLPFRDVPDEDKVRGLPVELDQGSVDLHGGPSLSSTLDPDLINRWNRFSRQSLPVPLHDQPPVLRGDEGHPAGRAGIFAILCEASA